MSFFDYAHSVFYILQNFIRAEILATIYIQPNVWIFKLGPNVNGNMTSSYNYCASNSLVAFNVTIRGRWWYQNVHVNNID
jgi:hypothetical protein